MPNSHSSPNFLAGYLLAHPLRSLIGITLFLRLLSIAYLLIIHPFILLPSSRSFDSSASLLHLSVYPNDPPRAATIKPVPEWLIPVTRWDVLYYAPIALRGYAAEKELAFFPGWPSAMRLVGQGVKWIREFLAGVGSSEDMSAVGLQLSDVVLGGTILATSLSVLTMIPLYGLTLELFPSSTVFPLVTCLLYTLQPSPATQVSPYTESPFAFLTFSGLYLYTKGGSSKKQGCFTGVPKILLRWMGVLLLVGASSIRSFGILTGLVVGWEGTMLVLWSCWQGNGSLLSIGRLFETIIQLLLIISPFVAFQSLAYMHYCMPEPSPSLLTPYSLGALQHIQNISLSIFSLLPPPSSSPEWCTRSIPLVYNYVQSKYWNIGFLNYWTLQQLPNFVLVLPVLIISVWTPYLYFKSLIPSIILTTTISQKQKDLLRRSRSSNPLEGNLTLFPYMISHTILTFTLIFSSHTQIGLRVGSGMIGIWWGLAAICFDWIEVDEGEEKKVGKGGEDEDGQRVGKGAEGREEQAGSVGMMTRRRRRVTESQEKENEPAREVERKKGRKTKDKIISSEKMWIPVRLNRVGRYWLRWVIIWGGISLVLWGCFLPPA